MRFSPLAQCVTQLMHSCPQESLVLLSASQASFRRLSGFTSLWNGTISWRKSGIRCIRCSPDVSLHELHGSEWLFIAQRLHVFVKAHAFDDACRAVRASEIHNAGSPHAVAVSATFSDDGASGCQLTTLRPQVFSVSAALANGAEHPIQFELRKVGLSSSGDWPRNMCHINYRGDPWIVPTDLATQAAFWRLTPLFQCTPERIHHGFTSQRPPPVPLELSCFRTEWEVQAGFDAMGLTHRGFLSAACWDRDVSQMMSAQEYAHRAQHLGMLLHSMDEQRHRVEPVSILVDEAVKREMLAMGEDPAAHTEVNEDEYSLPADLMRGWDEVIEVLKKRFAVRIVVAPRRPPSR